MTPLLLLLLACAPLPGTACKVKDPICMPTTEGQRCWPAKAEAFCVKKKHGVFLFCGPDGLWLEGSCAPGPCIPDGTSVTCEEPWLQEAWKKKHKEESDAHPH